MDTHAEEKNIEEKNIENEVETDPTSYLNDSDADFSPIQYSDSDSDSDDELNENPIELQNELPTNDFCNEMVKSKYKLYKIIILSPEDEESDVAQDNTLLEEYITKLDLLGQSIIKIINSPTNTIPKEDLKNYTGESAKLANDTMNYTNAYVVKNSNINKMLYSNYVITLFRTYPFFQLPTIHIHE
jgi:hypothetical protein